MSGRGILNHGSLGTLTADALVPLHELAGTYFFVKEVLLKRFRV